MPVSLEDMMREIPSDRRTEIERNAQSMVDDHRQRTTAGPMRPPALAEALIRAQMGDTGEAAIADLAEDFRSHVGRHGVRRARFLYWGAALGSALPLLMIRASRLIAPRWLANHLRRHL